MASLKSARTLSLIVLVAGLSLLAATAYAIVGSRNGLLGYRTAFTVLRWIAQAGGVVFVLSAIVLVVSLNARDTGAKVRAGVATLLTGVLVATMALYEAAPPPGPLINDVTTDLEDPPRFVAVVPLRPPGSNPIEYGGPEVAENQRQVHPEVQPIESSLEVGDAFSRALQAAESMGWDIVNVDEREGTIEAIDTTPFFRFKDDVVVRVRPTASGSRVDVRSRSRVGLSDLGKNAARIMAYRQAFSVER
jgi:uncharacterized protein (DUF1499 family)